MTCLPQRPRPYRDIHKALRAQMADALVRVGSADASDCADALDAVDALVTACESHLAHERDVMHAAMAARDPDATATFDDDHVGQFDENRRLRTLVSEARLGGHAADEALYRLYLALSRYVAHQFDHMAAEETTLTEAFWRHFDDAEIDAIHDRIVAAIPPQEMMTTLDTMIPAISHVERLAMLGQMRVHAPPEVFTAVVGIARRRLAPGPWARLARELALDPVGLAA